MASTVSKWIKKNVISKYMMTDCPQKQKCFEILNLILDGEADSEQEQYYKDHIDQCWTCYQDYRLESAIREMIKTKLEKKTIPQNLIDEIKSRISESP